MPTATHSKPSEWYIATGMMYVALSTIPNAGNQIYFEK